MRSAFAPIDARKGAVPGHAIRSPLGTTARKGGVQDRHRSDAVQTAANGIAAIAPVTGIGRTVSAISARAADCRVFEERGVGDGCIGESKHRAARAFAAL